MQQVVISGEYKLIKQLSKGKHSQIHHCVSIKSGQEFAIKFQGTQSSALLREANMLKSIQKQHHIIMDYGLPILYHCQRSEKATAIVQTMLGDNLQQLLQRCKGMFRIKTFLMVADQMLKRLQFLHRKEYIHRNITIRKWTIGLQQSNKKIYLVGFGKCKHYQKNGKHIPYSQNRPLLNQIAYASINNHLGLQPSRRDDLQSMLYCWYKMLYGKLPWQQQKEQKQILSKKIQKRSQILFQKCPQALKQIGRHIQHLNFIQEPDYQKMRNLMLQLFDHYNMEYSYSYDWEEIQNGEFK